MMKRAARQPDATQNRDMATLCACPVCGRELRPWAEIPARYVNEAFFTDDLRARVPALCYDVCPACRSLWATDARRDAELLDQIYAALPSEYWTRLSNDGRLYDHIDALLQRHAPGRALCDVGCGDGKLLTAVSRRWDKHGIEPGEAAARLCRAQGIDVLFGTPRTVTPKNAFDAITCVDTLEHMLQPAEELRAIASFLRPGGVLLLFTGAPEAWTARLAGRWWEYLHCVGHVSILSGRAIRRLLADADLELIHQERHSHTASRPLPVWLRQYAANFYRRTRGYRYVRLPYCQDHQLLIAKRT